MPGLFICIEGGDGCGKTTIADRLAADISNKNIPVTVVADPGGSPFAQACRSILLDTKIADCDPQQQTLLFTAARRALVQDVRQLLAENQVVITGRWVWSTKVYQGVLGGVSQTQIEYLHRVYVELDPAITVLLDVTPEKAHERRLLQRGERAIHGDRFESMENTKRETIRNGYLEFAKQDRSPVIHTDNMTVDEVYTAVKEKLYEYETFRYVIGQL